MRRSDTIVAAATPPGRGGVGIVRISGPKVPELAAVMLGELPKARHATFARFLDAQQDPIDAGLALFFPAPHSYTGEHVLELHGHGGPLVVEAVVARVVELGARRAQAGEFTQRAFLNDKVELAQAEAIADLIDAGSREAARAAMRSLQGEFSAMVHGLTEAVVELRTYVEAAIDFPEEEIDLLADGELTDRFASVREHFEGVLPSARQMPLHVLDTAGLRDGGDVVEEEGMRRARAEMQRADRVLFVIDTAEDPDGRAFRDEQARLPEDVPVTLVFNKCDLAAGVPLADTWSGPPRVMLSALTGEGLDGLRAHLKQCMGFQTVEGRAISARRRPLEAS